MEIKKFEYVKKDAKMVRKDVFFRILFAILFIIVFSWQLIMFYNAYTEETITKIQYISSICVLSASLLMGILSIMYAFKSRRILKRIKKSGTCVSSVSLFFSTKKDSFIKLYRVLNAIFAILTLIVTVCAITYAILKYNYYIEISYYLPILVCTCLSCFFSTYHISNEIKIYQMVEQFNDIF